MRNQKIFIRIITAYFCFLLSTNLSLAQQEDFQSDAEAFEANEEIINQKKSGLKKKAKPNKKKNKKKDEEKETAVQPIKVILKEGETSPSFNGKNQFGNLISLSNFSGKKVVVFFFQKHGDPIDTQEILNFRTNYQDFLAKNIEIIGVSYEPIKHNFAFAKHYNILFHLLDDSEKKIASLYGVNNENVAQRATFLVDENGMILKIFREVAPHTHSQQVLLEFSNITKLKK